MSCTNGASAPRSSAVEAVTSVPSCSPPTALCARVMRDESSIASSQRPDSGTSRTSASRTSSRQNRRVSMRMPGNRCRGRNPVGATSITTASPSRPSTASNRWGPAPSSISPTTMLLSRARRARACGSRRSRAIVALSSLNGSPETVAKARTAAGGAITT